MKRLICAMCMLTAALCMSAQEESKPAWITGEQESSFPGEMIEYAVSQSPTVIEGENGPITVSLNAMIFRGALRYFFSSKGENFVVDNLQTQKVLLQIDDQRATNYSLVGNNSYTSNTLNFDGSYRNQFKKLLKKGGKKCTIEVEFEKSGKKTVEFNIEGLPEKFTK